MNGRRGAQANNARNDISDPFLRRDSVRGTCGCGLFVLIWLNVVFRGDDGNNNVYRTSGCGCAATRSAFWNIKRNDGFFIWFGVYAASAGQHGGRCCVNLFLFFSRRRAMRAGSTGIFAVCVKSAICKFERVSLLVTHCAFRPDLDVYYICICCWCVVCADARFE